MITPEYLRRIAVWSRELSEREIEMARAGITEKSYRPGELIFLRGDHFEYWTGVVSGLVRMGTVSRGGKAMTFTALTAVTLGTVLTALIAVLSTTPGFAGVGGGVPAAPGPARPALAATSAHQVDPQDQEDAQASSVTTRPSCGGE